MGVCEFICCGHYEEDLQEARKVEKAPGWSVLKLTAQKKGLVTVIVWLELYNVF